MLKFIDNSRTTEKIMLTKLSTMFIKKNNNFDPNSILLATFPLLWFPNRKLNIGFMNPSLIS